METEVGKTRSECERKAQLDPIRKLVPERNDGVSCSDTYCASDKRN